MCDFDYYKNLTFWIRGIRRTFWSWGSADILRSVLQRICIRKLYKMQTKIDFSLSSGNFIYQDENDIIRIHLPPGISLASFHSPSERPVTLVNTQHSTMVNILIKKKRKKDARYWSKLKILNKRASFDWRKLRIFASTCQMCVSMLCHVEKFSSR